ncbi:MAG: hypothetical protein IJS90_10655 [Clostridia bacterium]|nr:hypothetical protein [Clostridia bacterium]
MKKILCVFLCISLVFGSLVAGLAGSAPESEAAGAYPVVVVRGMDFLHGLRYYPGTENEVELNAVSRLSFGGIVGTLGKAFAGFITGGKDAAVQAIIDYAATVFEGYGCDKNGVPLDGSVSNDSYPLSITHYPEALAGMRYDHEEGLVHSCADRYGAENVYYFKYDWRLDTLENAALLSDMIELAVSEHETDKVDLVCNSMGGIVTLTYLNYYGSGRIDSLVANSSTMYGTDVTTDLFQGKVYFDEDAVCRFLSDKVPALSLLFKTLHRTKVIKLICDFLNKFAEDYKTEIYEGVLTPVFGTMPAFWELCRHEEYEAAKQFIFGDKAQEYAGLIAKTDKIQYEVVANVKNIIDGAMANGMKFGVTAGYNIPNTPAYENAALQGDGTLETRMMSFGATVSVVGSELKEDELSGSEKYISADRCINANTAMYKDYTWFVRNGRHVGCQYNSEYTFLIFSILESEVQPTVDTWEKYPQFTVSDDKENLSPLKAQEAENVNSPC